MPPAHGRTLLLSTRCLCLALYITQVLAKKSKKFPPRLVELYKEVVNRVRDVIMYRCVRPPLLSKQRLEGCHQDTMPLFAEIDAQVRAGRAVPDDASLLQPHGWVQASKGGLDSRPSNTHTRSHLVLIQPGPTLDAIHTPMATAMPHARLFVPASIRAVTVMRDSKEAFPRSCRLPMTSTGTTTST